MPKDIVQNGPRGEGAMFSNSTLRKSLSPQPFTWPLVLQTTDVEEASSFLASLAVPYRSELLASGSTFSTQVFGTHSPRMQLSRVRTTGAMRVEAQLPRDSYAIVLGVAGNLEHRVAGEQVRVSSESGLVQSPLQPVEVQTPGHFELLFLKLNRDILVQELEKLLGRGINAPLVFSPSLRTQVEQRFRHLLLNLSLHLGQEANDDQQDGEHCVVTRGLENELVTLLLEAQRHNYTRLLARNHDAVPYQIRMAEEYISANAHLILSLGDICVAAGVGSRTLQHGFQRKRGYSPMQFLRRLRLERAHEDLSHPDAGTTVTRTASGWGFLHFGRFAGEYHMRFGEKPSETLKRALGRR